jgi:hypothetical protein
MQPAECILQWLKHVLTKATSGRNRQLWVIGQVGHPFHSRYFAMKEISHEE